VQLDENNSYTLLLKYNKHFYMNDEVVYDDLQAIEKDCWHRLVNGALLPGDALHNPVVANANAQGINMRTVVLRKTCPVDKQLYFYTDIRSGKWAELQLQNNISWLFYDANASVQIRASGFVSLHHKDELADKAWEACNIMNRKNYLSVLAPSVETSAPTNGLSPEFYQADFTKEQSEAARKNFGVVVTNIQWMEWLWLNKNGHRRANFIYSQQGNFTANWLVP